MSSRKLNIDKVLASVQSKVSIENAHIHDVVQISDNLFHVTAHFNVSDKFTSPQKMRIALAKALEHKAVPVRGTFRKIASKYPLAVAGFVSTVPESLEFTDEVASSGRFVSVASAKSNVMLDTQDEQMWEVSAHGDKKYLVRNMEEDLSHLVTLASNSQRSIRSSGSDVISAAIQLPQLNLGDVVSYVDQETASVKFGRIVGTITATYENEDGEEEEMEDLEVIEFDGEKEMSSVQVSPYAVICAAEIDEEEDLELDEDTKAETASLDAKSTEELKAYYAKLYGKFPKYYAEIEETINENAVM